MKYYMYLVAILLFLIYSFSVNAEEFNPSIYLEKYCHDCHDSDSFKGNQDFSILEQNFDKKQNYQTWLKIFDSLDKGEMPPKKKKRPDKNETTEFLGWLANALSTADKKQISNGRPTLRRITAAEYENITRDLFKMPGLKVKELLPIDGTAHGFNKNIEALSISHVSIAKYIEAADHILDYAIATRPQAPTIKKNKISLACRGSGVAHIIMNGDGILIKNKKIDPDFPPAGHFKHIDEGAHEIMQSFETGSTIGLFRHEDATVSPYFKDHVTIYPGNYKVRTSLWSFQWDKGSILPSRRVEAGRLSVVQLTGDGRGGQHPSYVLGYYDAPSLEAKEHEETVWLNTNEMFGFNTASLVPVANHARKGRAMAFTGPGIAVDWLTVEGPFYESWPPPSHKILFGDLPILEFKSDNPSLTKPPIREKARQLGGKNKRDFEPGIWTVHSSSPIEDAKILLEKFLPKAFRRPVVESTIDRYHDIVKVNLGKGMSFESSMRIAYKHALCSPDFLYHIEYSDLLDNYSLVNRLSFFLRNSLPDANLQALAESGDIENKETLKQEVERLLNESTSKRFIQDFLGQWLNIAKVPANDPDKKLYPEFSSYLQDSMILESESYFGQLLRENLPVSYLVNSEFVMINGVLARLYGIEGVEGPLIRKVNLPDGSPRGGILTQASIMKVTANGTTTSPVVRGTYVMERIIGNKPKPPPPNISAIEPDVRGTNTIRELLEKHRENSSCSSCHSKIDPPGFALESFDVIGGYRENYRIIGEGESPQRGLIDPLISLRFKLGPKVNSSGQMSDGRSFKGINEFKSILASMEKELLINFVTHLSIYCRGHEVSFSERFEVENIVFKTQKRGGGLRTLIHEFVLSPLFKRK